VWAVQLSLHRPHHLVTHPLNGLKKHSPLLHAAWGSLCCIGPCCRLLLLLLLLVPLPAEDASANAFLWDNVALCRQELPALPAAIPHHLQAWSTAHSTQKSSARTAPKRWKDISKP
jgi:hypothetical protein